MYPNYSYGSYKTFQTSKLCRYFFRYLILNSYNHSSLFKSVLTLIIQFKIHLFYIELPRTDSNRQNRLLDDFRLSSI
ncbi:hypothetical protein F383_24799 [Gossypium arboreum]|uniref:Uncharacterized protein n=1 Tax=Gossypium arboreum TaxID=29729 RepID=A0A0B0MQ81_GOSAR|nr:hypothetical protein F383_24799 [Gossypium arboreum]